MKIRRSMGIDPGSRNFAVAIIESDLDSGDILKVETANYDIFNFNPLTVSPENLNDRLSFLEFLLNDIISTYSPFAVGLEKISFNPQKAGGFDASMSASKIIKKVAKKYAEGEDLVYDFTPSDVKTSVGVSRLDKNKNSVLRGIVNVHEFKGLDIDFYSLTDHEIDALVMARMVYLKTITYK